MENNIGLLFDTPYSVIVRCFASPYACVKYIIYIYIFIDSDGQSILRAHVGSQTQVYEMRSCY